ncbi:MAG: sigma-70 family RNA polymerase sigma factor [Phycisphaerae bacterium]|nr:sigma-70 family RNA polymerase sigma factor [Phycisphaerae bacterium]
MTRLIRSIARYLDTRPIEMNSLEDAAALALYASRRDPRAFEVLVFRYEAMVFHTCRRVIASQADAEDAAQETFLKLARRAGEIRSNVAAWLHACALRTSVDLLRSQATRARAEAGASVPADRSEMCWREIKPLLDDAIAALDEADRELIVTRFLAGRSQLDMAREARVHPGTMHRRIDAALGRLRTQLAQRGVAPALGAGAGLGIAGGIGATLSNESIASVLGHAGAGSPNAMLTPSLVSIGLADVGTGAAVGSAGGTLAAILLASVVGVGVLGGGLYLASGGGPQGGAVALPTAGGFDRPTEPASGARLVRQSSGDSPDGSLTHDGDTIRLLLHKKDRVQEVAMKIVSASGDATLDKTGKANGTMRVRFTEWEAGPPFMRDQLLGNERDASYEVDGELFTLKVKLGLRVPPAPPGQPQTESPPEEIKVVLARTKPLDPRPPAARLPAIAGTWEFINDCHLQMDSESITFLWIQEDGTSFPGLKFRVLEWENAGDRSKIQTIVTASAMDQGMVGKRIKLLARREANGWTLVWNDLKSRKQNEWPAGFDAKPGEVVRFVFQESGR